MGFSFADNKVVGRIARECRRALLRRRSRALRRKYHDFTMVPRRIFAANLILCAEYAPPNGCIIECGVWRGGMSAAMADILPGRTHLLFDSFEGLPPATAMDGEAALNYQRDTSSPT